MKIFTVPFLPWRPVLPISCIYSENEVGKKAQITWSPGWLSMFLTFILKSVPRPKSTVSNVILLYIVDIYILKALSSELTSWVTIVAVDLYFANSGEFEKLYTSAFVLKKTTIGLFFEFSYLMLLMIFPNIAFSEHFKKFTTLLLSW